MKPGIVVAIVAAPLVVAAMVFSCKAQAPRAATGWDEAKRTQIPVCAMPVLYEKPLRQPMASLAWEDGVYVSRDGLTLYADYFQSDLLSFANAGANVPDVWKFKRGPSLNQDFSNPLGRDYPWIHGDVAMSTRPDKSAPFGPWRLSNMRGKFFNLGGVAGFPSGKNGGFDYVVYTSDVKDGVKIKLMKNVGRELAGDDKGVLLPPNVDDPRYHEDNPHIERPDPSRPKHLVLFFDSENWPGRGMRDIFYSESEDDGSTWSGPFPLNSVNTPQDDEQPHLSKENGVWWLYMTGTNQADHKLGIFRYRQGKPGDWDSWVDRELVVGAGTAAGVGEPTLTADGDLSFVVVAVNTAGGTATDRYDCDPWFMKRKRPAR